MPEGTGDAGRQAAMPPGGAAEDCSPDWGQDRRLGASRTPLTLRAPCLSLWEGSRGTMVWRPGALCVAGPRWSLWTPEGLVVARVYEALRPTRREETPRLHPMGQRLSHGATLLPVPGPLPHRRGPRTPAHAPGSAPGGLRPSGVLLLPCATEGLRVRGPAVALKTWSLFELLRVYCQEEGA
jgi:hypothetical protein